MHAGLIAIVAAAVLGMTGPRTAVAQAPQAPQAIGHVFTIVLENKDYSTTFGRGSQVPYLSHTLRGKGALLANYYGITHASLGNYLAMISGRPPTARTRADCPRFDCVYGPEVRTLADTLQAAGHSWKGYMEDIPAPCALPVEGRGDPFRKATRGSQYATRHDPFVYFRSITDDRARCRSHVVGLSRLSKDLAVAERTPDYAFITPDLCHDGHDETCANPRQPGGYDGIDAFLRRWVPRILASPAFRQDGLLLITFDESETDDRRGGGRIGGVLIGKGVARGSTVYAALDHYGYLRSVEDLFALEHLGPDAATFQSAGAFGR
jgi:hypothetical protein